MGWSELLKVYIAVGVLACRGVTESGGSTTIVAVDIANDIESFISEGVRMRFGSESKMGSGVSSWHPPLRYQMYEW